MGVEFKKDAVSFTNDAYTVSGLGKINDAIDACKSDDDVASLELTARELRLIRRLLILDNMHDTLLLSDRVDRVTKFENGKNK